MIAIQFLAEWALRSSILIVSGALLLKALRVKDPSIRWAAWTAMLCASLAIPALTVALPKLPLVVMRAAPAQVQAPVMVYSVPEEPMPAMSPPNVGMKRPVVSVSEPFDWARAAVMTYVLVALVLLLRLCFGLAMSLRLLRSGRVTGRATEGIEIRESERVASPVTLGIARPIIVLPADWREWDRAKLDAVLAHERSHIRRHDPAVQLLSAIHWALLWHTPLSWFLHRRIVRAAEEASDDAALAVSQDRALYAQVLLDFIQRGVRGPSWQGVPMSRHGRAEKRIHRILDGKTLSRGVTRWSLAAILALGLPLAYLVAAAYPETAPQTHVAAGPAAPVPTLDQGSRNVHSLSRQWTPFEAHIVDRQYHAGNQEPFSIENYVYARRDDGSWVKFEPFLPNGKRLNQRIVEDYSTLTRTSIDPSMKSLIKIHYSTKDVDDLSTPPRACSDSKAAHVEIQGYDTVEVRFTEPGPGEGFPVTEWRAPRLNCFALKRVMVWGISTLTREALNVKEGAPADSLFEIPSTYTELPSEGMAERAWRSANEPEKAPTESVRPFVAVVYILGAVQKPGAYPLPRGEKLTIAQSVAQAGGLNQTAKRPARISIIRKCKNGTRTEISIDLNKALDAKEVGVELNDGDILYLPTKPIPPRSPYDPPTGQNPEPVKAQAENAGPGFFLKPLVSPGANFEHGGVGNGTTPSFLTGGDLLALQRQPIPTFREKQTRASVPGLNLPPAPGFAWKVQTAPAPTLDISHLFNSQRGQTVAAVIPKAPYALLPQIPPQQSLCSVPLLRVQPPTGTHYTMQEPGTERTGSAMAMAVRPLAPSCDAVIPEGPKVTPADLIRVAPQVESAKLIFHPPPEYPALAKMARIQGVVRLDAVISRDGTVKYLKVISGHPLLVDAARDAVGRWRYQPTLLNGERVEVWTEIDLNFTLPQ